jgi:hypothetical protein
MQRLSVVGTIVGLMMTIPLQITPALALWEEDGNPICSADGRQDYVDIAVDGAGGAILTWPDLRGEDWDVYVQRVDGSGALMWMQGGAAACVAPGHQVAPRVVSDGMGGAIIAWLDGPGEDWDVYAQRVGSFGNVMWIERGVPICTAEREQQVPRITADGLGGAIITWFDERSGEREYDIYAQRVSSSGVVLWAVDGLLISTARDDQTWPEIISDGAGGAIITWRDYRNGYADVYAQKVDASGNLLWSADGVPVCTAPRSQGDCMLAPDGAGGAIMAWLDLRNDHHDIFAQRVDASGNPLWRHDGIEVYTGPSDGQRPQICSDGSGGAIIVWIATDPQDHYEVLAQRIDASGRPAWTEGGIPLCSSVGLQLVPKIVSDGVGGAVIVWRDGRNPNWDIYAQRMDASGNVLWKEDGLAVSRAAGHQWNPEVISDGASGVIAAWRDDRRGSDFDDCDIYAQRVSANGCAGSTGSAFASGSASGERGYVILTWQMQMDVSASSFIVQRSELPEDEFLTLDLPIDRDKLLGFSCSDYSVSPGESYWYRMLLVNPYCEEAFGPFQVYVEPLPIVFAAHQSFPNPFNPFCTIRYDIPKACRVTLRVFDVSGFIVRTLVDRWEEPGFHNEIWDGMDEDERELPSGVYFYRLEAGDFAATRKMVLLK